LESPRPSTANDSASSLGARRPARNSTKPRASSGGSPSPWVLITTYSSRSFASSRKGYASARARRTSSPAAVEDRQTRRILRFGGSLRGRDRPGIGAGHTAARQTRGITGQPPQCPRIQTVGQARQQLRLVLGQRRTRQGGDGHTA